MRKAIFMLFGHHVPLKMLRGEYEKYFSDISEKQGQASFVIVGLGTVLMGICIMEITGAHLSRRKNIAAVHAQ